MRRYLCIHGHYYQPPRENPWLEAIEVQDSARPYHDWNERITAECYAPNSAARILDTKGRIRAIVNNYSRMSFNIGPTLIGWLERNSPELYAAILDADRDSAVMRSGHGAALAQAYNHVIMPLASARDKATQCAWGIRDFSRRFGRDPEGMWLPETAADTATLDVLASFGIKFTILAQHQARRTRQLQSNDWRDAHGGRIDPAKPYIYNLPSGRQIVLFFYDGAVSRAVAFEGLLRSGVDFANRLLSGFSDRRNYPQLMHIATDGESYGHHHKFGEMALAFALDHIEQKGLATLTNYGEYLELHPPADEVRIHESTSWSCAHGVERWRGDCGCCIGGKPKWNQKWRGPLRESLDWLRDAVTPRADEETARAFRAPDAARLAYIDVVLNRSATERYLAEHAVTADRTRAVALMELHRNMQLMYTSCGWFFDDLGGIETLQVMMYAARVVQMADSLLGLKLEDEFTGRLALARSNDPALGSGADLYMKRIKPSVVELRTVAAHYAISSLFTDYTAIARVFCYEIERMDYHRHTNGGSALVIGRCRVVSEITGERDEFFFGLLHMGGHDFTCGVRRDGSEHEFLAMASDLRRAFEQGSMTETVNLLDVWFGRDRQMLETLFRDERRKVLDILVRDTHEAFEEGFRQIYEGNRKVMEYFRDTAMPVHKAFLAAAEFTLNKTLMRLLVSGGDACEITDTLGELREWKLQPDTEELAYAFRHTLEARMMELFNAPADIGRVDEMIRVMEIAGGLPFTLNLWMTQNLYARLCRTVCVGTVTDPSRADWAARFKALGKNLNFNTDALSG